MTVAMDGSLQKFELSVIIPYRCFVQGLQLGLSL